jgi:hypothetical protein
VTARSITDDEDICARFARRRDSEGYTEAEFKQAMESLLAAGLIRRVAYRAPDGTIRYKIKSTAKRRGPSRLSASD